MSRTSDIHEELTRAWSSLQAAWHDTRAGWKDEVADRFEGRFFADWEAVVPSYLEALETLKDEIKASRRELR